MDNYPTYESCLDEWQRSLWKAGRRDGLNVLESLIKQHEEIGSYTIPVQVAKAVLESSRK